MKWLGTNASMGEKARTIGFLVAMTPLLILVAILGILSLFFLTPVVIYAGSIRGKPLKSGQRGVGAALRREGL
jgi:hypothetical protein